MKQKNIPSSNEIYILVGHRGTGKSHFLKLLKSFYQKKKLKALFFDLDEEIEKHLGQSLNSLFQKGEAFFRRQEKNIFQKILQTLPKNKTCFISVGAGFKFKKQAIWTVIYLGRPTDKIGRVFLNRPRLNPSQEALGEYLNLYKKRENYYLKTADEHLIRREHFKQLELSDLLFLGIKKLKSPFFTLRLNPQDVPQNTQKLKPYLQKRLGWALRYFELNDETADKNFIQLIQSVVAKEKLLYSSQKSTEFLSIQNKVHWSWDLSLGSPPKGVSILTLHDRKKQNLKSLLKEFSIYKSYHLKLAIEIHNLEELQIAYHWFCEDSKNRSFLPRSKDGRWLWFRQVFGPQMELHFIKEKRGALEVLDQPFLSQALPFINNQRALKNRGPVDQALSFAGVLGDPIAFSATPAEQSPFFYDQKGLPVLAISLKEKEMTKKNLDIFKQLGFVFFAVTSPLKKKAFLLAGICDSISKKLQTANTLIFHNNLWKAYNTDWYAFQKLKKYSSPSTVVWGGEGIRPTLKLCLPKAQFYSARKGKLISPQKNKASFSPKFLIWAVGRKRLQEGCLWPPKHWKPLKVIDINYTEDSPGLEYALQNSSHYINGTEFFKEQAKKQREIFEHK